ncbi:MAG: hypothetical protein GF392_02815 [Candidatus Omnitrophica bacterium]|nr:hypothetical protein [Candidatus Omnitrophota bacterium]
MRFSINRKDIFMVLNILRSKKVTKRVLLVILILIIPAFVLWGVGSLTDRPEPLGRIYGQKVYPEDLRESIQGIKAQVLMTYSGNLRAANSMLRDRELVNYMAWERLVLLAEAEKKDIRVPDATLTAFIASHPLFQRNGVFDAKIYEYILRNNFGMDSRRFEELLRENIKVRNIRRDITGGIEVTDAEALEFFRKMNDQVNLSYFVVPPPPVDEDTRIPRSELLDFYRLNISSFSEAPRVEAEYIAIPYTSRQERKAAMEMIREQYPGIRSGAEDLAGTAGELGLEYGRTGPFSEKDMIPGIKFSRGMQETVFQLETGEISSPVITGEDTGAIYIFRKTAEIPARTKPFAEVSDAVAVMLRKDKRRQAAFMKASSLMERVISGEMSFREAADSVGASPRKAENVSSDGYIDSVGPAENIVREARNKGEGELLSPKAAGNGAALIRVDRIIPAGKEAFAGQKDDIKLKLLSYKQRRAMEKWFQEKGSRVQLFRESR